MGWTVYSGAVWCSVQLLSVTHLQALSYIHFSRYCIWLPTRLFLPFGPGKDNKLHLYLDRWVGNSGAYLLGKQDVVLRRQQVSFTWDCVFTVGKDATTTVDGGTSTIGDGNARTITAAPQTITVTQTQQETTTSTSVVDPGATAVRITSTVTQGASARRRDLLPAFWPDTRAIPNFEYPLEVDRSNCSAELVERSCGGSQCSLLCCKDLNYLC